MCRARKPKKLQIYFYSDKLLFFTEIRAPSLRGSQNSNGFERMSWERSSEGSRGGRRASTGGIWKGSPSMDNIDIAGGTGSNRHSLSDDDNHDQFPFRNMVDVSAKESDFSFVGGGPRKDLTNSPVSTILIEQIN